MQRGAPVCDEFVLSDYLFAFGSPWIAAQCSYCTLSAVSRSLTEAYSNFKFFWLLGYDKGIRPVRSTKFKKEYASYVILGGTRDIITYTKK